MLTRFALLPHATSAKPQPGGGEGERERDDDDKRLQGYKFFQIVGSAQSPSNCSKLLLQHGATTRQCCKAARQAGSRTKQIVNTLALSMQAWLALPPFPSPSPSTLLSLYIYPDNVPQTIAIVVVVVVAVVCYRFHSCLNQFDV